MRTWLAAAAALIMAISIAGCTGTPEGRPGGAGTAAGGGSAPEAVLESTFEKAIEETLPSIVQITTSGGLGSGVVHDAEGHIVTNAHVVGDSKDLEVTLPTGGKPKAARLVAAFPEGDLAVIKVDDPKGLRPARFADSSEARVGQFVLAMGNPLGLSASVTNGIVSAVGRTVSAPRSAAAPGTTLTDMIQTSAAINPGNSGGALVNMDGKVVGIPTLAATDPEMGKGPAPGIGFAISSNMATDISKQIIERGKVVNSRKAALGIVGRTVIGGNDRPAGVGVVRVTGDGGADRAGIRPGDVIVAVNGMETPTQAELSGVLAEFKPGDQVKVDVIGDEGREEQVTVTLGELPAGG